jgi:SAM-dependent methyltransferase
VSRDYADYWSRLANSHASHPGNRFRYELIADRVSRIAGEFDKVIDCGCGDGSLLAYLASRVRCGELHGVDVALSPLTHQICKDLRFALQDMGQPVPPSLHGRFDLVLCAEVIEHVPGDQVLLENLVRLARPGGIVVLTTQSGRIYKTEQFLGHLRHYDFAGLCSRVEAAGLRVTAGFRCGWPWLNLQKIGAHIFQGTVQKRVVQAQRLGTGIETLFALLSSLYRFSSHSAGPQIFLLARKPGEVEAECKQ